MTETLDPMAAMMCRCWVRASRRLRRRRCRGGVCHRDWVRQSTFRGGGYRTWSLSSGGCQRREDSVSATCSRLLYGKMIASVACQ